MGSKGWSQFIRFDSKCLSPLDISVALNALCRTETTLVCVVVARGHQRSLAIFLNCFPPHFDFKYLKMYHSLHVWCLRECFYAMVSVWQLEAVCESWCSPSTEGCRDGTVPGKCLCLPSFLPSAHPLTLSQGLSLNPEILLSLAPHQ